MEHEDIEKMLALSYYKEIATLNKEHGITLVQHIETYKVYVKKEVSLVVREIYKLLKDNHIPGTPRIYEVIEYDGRLIVIEEQITGRNLQEIYEEKGPFTEKEVIDLTIKLCDILQKLHSFKPPVIHRDIKPSNIILKDDGNIVLLDFDAAKEADPTKSLDTYLIGTQGFAAPEQCGFGSSYIPTDIYGTGNLMLALLTGDTDKSKLKKSGLSKVIQKCLKMNPEDRYQSAKALKHALIRKKPGFKITVVAAVVVLLLIGYTPDKSKSAAPEPESITVTQSESATAVAHLEPSTTQPETVAESVESTEPETSAIDTTTPIGAYSGKNDEKLVLDTGGLAYYYCYDDSYTELQCPYVEENNTIQIYLSKLHCTITADVDDGDYSKLFFKSDSVNWDDENFRKISSDSKEYLKSPPSASGLVSVLEDGTMVFNIGSFTVQIPRQFVDYGVRYNNSKSMYTFIESNADTGYAASTLFYLKDVYPSSLTETVCENLAKKFAGQFMNNVQVGYTEEIKVAGEPAFATTVTGNLNSGFSTQSNQIHSGEIVILKDPATRQLFYILLIQTVGVREDSTDVFEKILVDIQLNQ